VRSTCGLLRKLKRVLLGVVCGGVPLAVTGSCDSLSFTFVAFGDDQPDDGGFVEVFFTDDCCGGYYDDYYYDDYYYGDWYYDEY
jgi:hypothetical protein